MDRENVIKGLEDIQKHLDTGYSFAIPWKSELIRDALALLKEQQQQIWELQDQVEYLTDKLKEQEWHLLTEDADGIINGLPGDDGQYLMTDGKDIWIDDYVDGVDDGIWLDSGRDIREIRAWMYMPNLPKQEGR